MSKRERERANKRAVEPKCKICCHENKAGIELLALTSAVSWAVAEKKINNTFDTNISQETIKNHMNNHKLEPTAASSGIILSVIKDEQGNPGFISSENILETVLLQGLIDLAKGRIRIKTANELIQVINMYEKVKQAREGNSKAFENSSPEEIYYMMAAWGDAMRKTLTEQQLAAVSSRARMGHSKGVVDITNLEPPLETKNLKDVKLDKTIENKLYEQGGCTKDVKESHVLDEADKDEPFDFVKPQFPE